MYVYVYIFMCVYMYEYTCIYTYVCMCTLTCKHMMLWRPTWLPPSGPKSLFPQLLGVLPADSLKLSLPLGIALSQK